MPNIAKNKFLITFTIGIIAAGLLIWQYLIPKVENFQKISNDLKAKEKIEAQALAVEAYQNKQKDNILVLKKEAGRLEKLIPKDVNESDIIIQIDSLGKANGVSVSNISISQAKTAKPAVKSAVKTTAKTKTKTLPPPLTPHQVKLSLRGGLANIESFFNQLTRLDRLVSIEKIVFSPGDTEHQVILDAIFYTKSQ